ncbi:hypothetical protein [Ochrobactrum chromiisoli]|uniref:Uncharacterized protein n=1 Tax=Ochrobactrum chromiisoli TaxID=2993941 RepID=A0ABT3QN75_9HYPH|nr:hypothetical protein [Ochrobactrum chromiisoli]MCX2697069.1 hypothetical protein [Ochrobactrum chromiisoli]
MEKKTCNVTLSAPAKIGGKFRKAGEQVQVTDTELIDLMQANAINSESVRDNSFSLEDSDELDLELEEAAKAMAEKIVDQAITDALLPITNERDDLKMKLEAEISNVSALTLRAETAEKSLSEMKLTEDQVAEIREEARKASVANIGSIAEWLVVEENAKAVSKLNDTKAAKAVSEALGREITEPEYRTAVTALALSK